MQSQKVMFHGKNYIIVYEYDSGYCEIREEGFRNHIKLVHKSELTSL